jgi:hypothetical protein
MDCLELELDGEERMLLKQPLERLARRARTQTSGG